MSVPFKGNYIGGRFIRPPKGADLISEDPGDLLEPIGRMIVSADPVDEAVSSADKAYPKWSEVPLAKRIALMRAFGRILRQREKPLIQLVVREAGKPLSEATREIQRLNDKIDEMITLGLKLVQPFSTRVGPGVQGECRWRPLGVLAVIGPFNFPAHTPASHFIPALLTGNTVVLKPSEYTPFVAQMLAECAAAAGFPPGTFNLVQGGAEVGARLVEHPGIAGVLFTGSTAAGQAIKEATLPHPHKALALEMGGKNAALVLSDADVELAARESMVAAFSMGGQRCNATSRIILNKRIAKQFLSRFLELTDRIKIGYPMEPDVLMGPLISHDAVAKFQKAMDQAKAEGFQVLRPGKALGRWGGRRGYYVTPSIHLWERSAKGRSKTVAKYEKEEVFGPDVAIFLVNNEEEAVALNNDVPYGLITSVFTRSAKRFRALLPKIDTGMVNFNRGTIYTSGKLPFGGTKASGSFRPAGLFSPYYCTVPISILSDTRPLRSRSYPL